LAKPPSFVAVRSVCLSWWWLLGAWATRTLSQTVLSSTSKTRPLHLASGKLALEYYVKVRIRSYRSQLSTYVVTTSKINLCLVEL